ncbi:hypothetical protein [Lampropedia aestuarii]|uniref:hypothetical protein n=1 Tax=Lampropedia aestuarii TaxID=2562762 RepID=UPI0024695C7D|nr:hypothetical protein [Lampropedia aestuarii]MDH5857756.1 hypothetical protein [Lampropedia aestuarii]
MKETGLMFKAPLVRAILSGHKTQTRRVVKGVKHNPNWGSAVGVVGGAWRYGSPAGLGLSDRGDYWSVTLDEDHQKRMCTKEAYGWGAGAGCPYGLPGDRIYVHETFAYAPTACGGEELTFAADYPDGSDKAAGIKHKPAIHMPRSVARIWLEITGVRVERLQDISHDDAMAEGMAWDDAIYDFQKTWESTGGDWDANPWVWVIDFKRIEKP